MALGNHAPRLWAALTGAIVIAAAFAEAARAAEGADLVGTRAPEWHVDEWVNSAPLDLADLQGRVVLVRWWTDTCPYCRASAGALSAFHSQFAAEGLVVVGMYHPKPPWREMTRADVEQTARAWGFRFPLGIDRDWANLRQWWLDGRERAATSVSFLIDRQGVIRYVHPGPAYAAEAVPGAPSAERDFAELHQAIGALLDAPEG